MVFDFILQHIIPLLSSNPSEDAIQMVEAVFWIFAAYVIAYFLVYLPYRFIRWAGRLPSPFSRKR